MGVEDGKYEIFRDFNRRVLSPAITEINTCSDIFITLRITRKGKKVHSILFELSERSIKKRLGVKQEADSKEGRLGLTDSSIAELIQKYGEERVGQGISYVESIHNHKADQIKNMGAYLRNAIEKNYAITQFDAEPDKVHKKAKITHEQQQQYNDYVIHYVMALYDTFSSEQQQAVLAQFEAQLAASSNLADSVTASVYRKHGIKSVAADFSHFFKQHYPADISAIKTIEQFIAEQVLELV